MTLRPPRQLDAGGRVYEAILVRAGDRLTYTWGTEVPTAEALSDPAYLDSLRGAPFAVHHPKGGLVQNGVPVTDGKGRRVGTVIGSRFDATEQAVVIEIAVHDPADQVEVERLGAVSEAYHADTQPVAARRSEQTRRRNNSVVATGEPRAASAHIRIDEQEPPMAEQPASSPFDAEKALKMIAEANTATSTEKTRADTAEASLAKIKADAKATEDARVVADKARADSREAEIDKLANERAAGLRTLQVRADALGVKLPDTAVTLAERKAALGKALGCPDGTPDPELYIKGVEKNRADSKGKGSADHFRDSAHTTETRADSADWPV